MNVIPEMRVWSTCTKLARCISWFKKADPWTKCWISESKKRYCQMPRLGRISDAWACNLASAIIDTRQIFKRRICGNINTCCITHRLTMRFSSTYAKNNSQFQIIFYVGVRRNVRSQMKIKLEMWENLHARLHSEGGLDRRGSTGATKKTCKDGHHQHHGQGWARDGYIWFFCCSKLNAACTAGLLIWRLCGDRCWQRPVQQGCSTSVRKD